MSPAARDVSSRETRVDIQWMRALAVGLVLLYHFWPNRVQGGFIGVDIFFVISGFLITSHLLRHPPAKFHDLAVFWGRRVRRLLPAAFLVILITLAAVWLIAPATQWIDNAKSAITAGLYVENWNLAAQSVDYLASTNAPTALQHYWSLSVEEQFYLVWPIIILLLALIARRNPNRFHLITGTGLGIVVAASLAWSIYYTAANPAAAYFVTPTRMWELGAGGVLAAGYAAINNKLKRYPAVQVGLVAIGVVMIVGSAFLVTGTDFPGWIATIPVFGAIIIIAAGPADYKISFDRVLKWRPIQFLGDISYSVYLWHWPIVVLIPLALGHALTWKGKLVSIALILLMSGFSKRFVEDKLRGQHPLGKPLRRTFIFLLAGMVTISATGAIFWATTSKAITVPKIDPTATCVGAQMLLDPQCQGQDIHGSKLLMTPLQAQSDMSEAYTLDCRWTKSDPQSFPFCDFGSQPSSTTVALFGNSHANPYTEPLTAIANDNGWSLRTYLASDCDPTVTLTKQFSSSAENKGCLSYTTNAISDMKQHDVKLVVMSVRSHVQTISGATELLNQLTSAGMDVLVIRDVPRHSTSIPDCVSAHPDSLKSCDGSRKDNLHPDPYYDAAAASTDPAISTLDLTDAICDTTTCYGVVGGVIVYFDEQHLTNTFAMTLQTPIESAMTQTLGT